MLLADLFSLIFTTVVVFVDSLSTLFGARYTLKLSTFFLVDHISVSRR